MQRRQAYQYELMPNGDQHRAMRRCAGSCRFVFNKALALQQAPRHQSGSMVGLDAGVARFATLPDGTVYAPAGSYRRFAARLTLRQRQMRRKTKFSNNWKKAKSRVRKLHSRIANSRRDFLHKTASELSKNHAMIVIEDLQVRHMAKSATGTVAKPGRQVRAKSGLNKAILDQGWFEFRRQLEYKQQWRGGWVIAVPPRNTSRRCLACGHAAKANRKTQARFACVACGYSANADLNAARNILAAGHAVLAHGESAQSGRSVKWEPAEASQAQV